jgi:hypothetical protein
VLLRLAPLGQRVRCLPRQALRQPVVLVATPGNSTGYDPSMAPWAWAWLRRGAARGRCEDGLDLCGHVGLPVALAMITGAYNGNARGPRTLVEGVDDAV